jgi:hypothetical protein
MDITELVFLAVIGVVALVLIVTGQSSGCLPRLRRACPNLPTGLLRGLGGWSFGER